MSDIPLVTIDELKADPVSAFRTGGGNPVCVTTAGGAVLFYMVSGFDLPSSTPAESAGLSLREAGELVEVSHTTIARDIKAGRLKAEMKDGKYEIDQQELERFYAGRAPGSKITRNT